MNRQQVSREHEQYSDGEMCPTRPLRTEQPDADHQGWHECEEPCDLDEQDGARCSLCE
jgi:hypothetical protein